MTAVAAGAANAIAKASKADVKNSEQAAAKASNAQVKKAAGSQSVELLQQVIGTGWTTAELDAMEDDKTALHMAAWRGSLDNLKYLVDVMGCNINVLATGEFSYGKTPIFFACTRSRSEHVEFLLERGAHVKIINNKGQSVLSLASSHLDEDLVRRIQRLEQYEQAAIPWINYRATPYSDGLEYGDLDPRFLERPLRPNEDVITEFAVNPTTKQSRKGSFLRRNPHMINKEKTEEEDAMVESSRSPKSHRKKTKKQQRELLSLSDQETKQVEQLWVELAHILATEPLENNEPLLGNLLLKLLTLSDHQQGQWLRPLAKRLSLLWNNKEESSILDVDRDERTEDPLASFLQKSILVSRTTTATTPRQFELVQKLVTCYTDKDENGGGDERGGAFSIDKLIIMSPSQWMDSRELMQQDDDDLEQQRIPLTRTKLVGSMDNTTNRWAENEDDCKGSCQKKQHVVESPPFQNWWLIIIVLLLLVAFWFWCWSQWFLWWSWSW